MKKGIIFTIDALVALSIFLVAVGILYNYFYEDPTFSLSGSGIYTKNENLLRMTDKAEILSSAVYSFQKGDNETAINILDAINKFSEFDSNLYLYLWNGTDMNLLHSIENIELEQKVVVRKILVFTVTRTLQKNTTDVSVEAPSSLAGKNITIETATYNSGGVDMTDLQATVVGIFDESGNSLSWIVTPGSISIPTVSPGETETVNFNLEIPEAAVIDEYYVLVNVEGTGFSQNATDPFNVFRFGMIEMVTGS